MGYKSVVVADRIFAVRWDDPTSDDVDDVVGEIRRLNGLSNQAVIYLGIIPQGCSLPNDEARASFNAHQEEMNALCASIHMVLLGTGLRFAAIRSSVAGMLLFGGTRRMHVDSSIESALKKTDVDPRDHAQICTKIDSFLEESSRSG